MTDRPRHLEPVPDDPIGPPSDIEAERAVLGAMLLNRTAIDQVADIVTGPEFYRPAHELIYDAILRLHLEGEPADVITVADELARTGQIKRAGGQTHLHELVQAVPLTSNATYYAQIVAERAGQRRLAELGARIQQLAYTQSGATVTELWEAASTALADGTRYLPASDASTNSWAPVDLTEILERGEVIEQPTILERTDGKCLLYAGAVHSISGEPESGKSWVALIAAAQVLRDPDGGHVTYVDFEDRPGRVTARLIHLGARPSAILERFHYIRPDDALDAPGRALLATAATQSSLAVVDGVTEAMVMHGLAINDNDDAAKFLGLLPRRLADLGPAVLQIDHVTKDSETRGRYAIGGQHKLAGLDGAAYGIKVLEPFARGKIGRAAIAVHKDRESGVREFALGNAVAHLVIDSRGDAMSAYLEEPQTIPKSSDGGLRPTHLMEKVSRYIEMNPGATRKHIEEGVTGKAPYIRMAIDALVRESYVSVTSGARGAQNHTVIAIYREAEDDAE